MLKTITKIGNSQGIILDAALMELAQLNVGDQLNVEVHEGGTISITPLKPRPSKKVITDTINSVMKDYATTMKKLS